MTADGKERRLAAKALIGSRLALMHFHKAMNAGDPRKYETELIKKREASVA